MSLIHNVLDRASRVLYTRITHMPALPKLGEQLPPVRLPREEAIAIRRLAREEYDSNMSALIRDLIRSHLARRRAGATP